MYMISPSKNNFEQQTEDDRLQYCFSSSLEQDSCVKPPSQSLTSFEYDIETN